VEKWSVGVMEYWEIKMNKLLLIDKIPLSPLFHTSSIPIFQLRAERAMFDAYL